MSEETNAEVEKLRDALRLIRAQATAGANATVKRMVAIADEALTPSASPAPAKRDPTNPFAPQEHNVSWAETGPTYIEDHPAPDHSASVGDMVLVPREPTVGMLRALCARLGRAGDQFAAQWALGTFAEDYRAMIAAASKPPTP